MQCPLRPHFGPARDSPGSQKKGGELLCGSKKKTGELLSGELLSGHHWTCVSVLMDGCFFLAYVGGGICLFVSLRLALHLWFPIMWPSSSIL